MSVLASARSEASAVARTMAGICRSAASRASASLAPGWPVRAAAKASP
jgi:hypothetical protein